MSNRLKVVVTGLVTGVVFGVSVLAFAGSGESGQHHGGHQEMMGHALGGESLAGMPGKAEDVSRAIDVIADDSMRFMHESFNIKEGETIIFVVTNKGKMEHEFSIATKDEHKEHGQMMISNPEMHHKLGGNTVSLKPGETKGLIWKFDNAWQIEAACNISGHYQAGMYSPISLKRLAAKSDQYEKLKSEGKKNL